MLDSSFFFQASSQSEDYGSSTAMMDVDSLTSQVGMLLFVMISYMYMRCVYVIGCSYGL